VSELDRTPPETNAIHFDATRELELARAVVRTRRAYWDVLLRASAVDAALELIAAHARDEAIIEMVAAMRRAPAAQRDAAALASALDRVGDEHAAANAIVEHAARTDVKWHAQARRARATFLAARDRFVRTNLGLVMLFARRGSDERIPFADRVQDGNVGLLKAVDRFDPERGVRFSTYAAWWIRHQIFRAFANGAHCVRVPLQVQALYRKAQRAQWQARAERGRDLDERELALALDCDPQRLAIALETAGRRGVSFDAGVDEQEQRGPSAAVCDEQSLTELEAVAHVGDYDRALALLDELPARERAVVQERFALPGATGDTFEEIGRRHGISRERARQVQRDALARLRSRLEPRPKLAPYVPA
jgi:RNA polymerase sigma factor (sigma-70 family)